LSNVSPRVDDVVVAPPSPTVRAASTPFGTLSIGIGLGVVLVELGRSADHFAVVFVNGHGGNAEPLAKAVATLRRATPRGRGHNCRGDAAPAAPSVAFLSPPCRRALGRAERGDSVPWRPSTSCAPAVSRRWQTACC
jgi:creatinine amidohydrolase